MTSSGSKILPLPYIDTYRQTHTHMYMHACMHRHRQWYVPQLYPTLCISRSLNICHNEVIVRRTWLDIIAYERFKGVAISLRTTKSG